VPYSHSLGQVQCSSPNSTVSVRLQFAVYVFQFCWGSSVYSGAVLNYVPGGWVRELHVVCVAHLFVLQFHTSSFGASLWVEMAVFLSALQCRENFLVLGVLDVAKFDSD
jgi:hypothetical protein